ncbi:hypothetical protein GGI04_004039 [Coemansia thaxteri]|nr:hypothetical protein GGI04_004039 [Coemansia thaxteri]
MSQEEVSKIGHWYCRACQHLVTRKRKSRAFAKNIFYPLISDLEFKNARTFSVPEDIRRQFDGIEADIDGTFINTREDRPLRANMGPANRDFFRLVDDHNEPIMCYRCGISALHGPIVRCDYCPLNWHWDCLDPPLSSAPPSRRRWMCPNHVDHVMPRRHKFRKERIVDLTDAPDTARNSGIVDIVDDDPPWHELFDPKIKYRLTSSRIRQEFSKNAVVCPSLFEPALPTQTLVAKSSLESSETLLAAGPSSEDVFGGTCNQRTPAAEWLLAMTEFQKDVVRYIAAPDGRAALYNACREKSLGDDRIALLSKAASQVLTPLVAPVDLNSGTGKAMPQGQSNSQPPSHNATPNNDTTQMPSAAEPDTSPSSKRMRLLADHDVREIDLRAAVARLLSQCKRPLCTNGTVRDCNGEDSAATSQPPTQAAVSSSAATSGDGSLSGAASNSHEVCNRWGFGKKALDKFLMLNYRYEVVIGTYVLDTWEKMVVNVLLLIFLVFVVRTALTTISTKIGDLTSSWLIQ